jgi:hypothetical protein
VQINLQVILITHTPERSGKSGHNKIEDYSKKKKTVVTQFATAI